MKTPAGRAAPGAAEGATRQVLEISDEVHVRESGDSGAGTLGLGLVLREIGESELGEKGRCGFCHGWCRGFPDCCLPGLFLSSGLPRIRLVTKPDYGRREQKE